MAGQMKNDKKIWFIEQYAHRIWTVSLSLAQEAARAGQYGRGYAVVAHEARIYSDKLFEYAEKIRFDGADKGKYKGLTDLTVMLGYLAVNAALEIQRMSDVNMDFNIPKSMAVFAEELRRLAIALSDLNDKPVWRGQFTLPEITYPLESTRNAGFFFMFSIGGVPLVESIDHIQEVYYLPADDITDGSARLRSVRIPVIDCYRRLNLRHKNMVKERHSVAVVCPARGNAEARYAVPIDDLELNALFYSKTGHAVPPNRGHAFADYARECWDAVGGDQLVFVDWAKFIE